MHRNVLTPPNQKTRCNIILGYVIFFVFKQKLENPTMLKIPKQFNFNDIDFISSLCSFVTFIV